MLKLKYILVIMLIFLIIPNDVMGVTTTICAKDNYEVGEIVSPSNMGNFLANVNESGVLVSDTIYCLNGCYKGKCNEYLQCGLVMNPETYKWSYGFTYQDESGDVVDTKCDFGCKDGKCNEAEEKVDTNPYPACANACAEYSAYRDTSSRGIYTCKNSYVSRVPFCSVGDGFCKDAVPGVCHCKLSPDFKDFAGGPCDKDRLDAILNASPVVFESVEFEEGVSPGSSVTGEFPLLVLSGEGVFDQGTHYNATPKVPLTAEFYIKNFDLPNSGTLVLWLANGSDGPVDDGDLVHAGKDLKCFKPGTDERILSYSLSPLYLEVNEGTSSGNAKSYTFDSRDETKTWGYFTSSTNLFSAKDSYFVKYCVAISFGENQWHVDAAGNPIYASALLQVTTLPIELPLPDSPAIFSCNLGHTGEQGETGEQAYLQYGFDRLLFDWHWEDVSIDECDASGDEKFCDATQFSISLAKKGKSIKDFIASNSDSFTKDSFFSNVEDFENESIDELKTSDKLYLWAKKLLKPKNNIGEDYTYNLFFLDNEDLPLALHVFGDEEAAEGTKTVESSSFATLIPEMEELILEIEAKLIQTTDETNEEPEEDLNSAEDGAEGVTSDEEGTETGENGTETNEEVQEEILFEEKDIIGIILSEGLLEASDFGDEDNFNTNMMRLGLELYNEGEYYIITFKEYKEFFRRISAAGCTGKAEQCKINKILPESEGTHKTKVTITAKFLSKLQENLTFYAGIRAKPDFDFEEDAELISNIVENAQDKGEALSDIWNNVRFDSYLIKDEYPETAEEGSVYSLDKFDEEYFHQSNSDLEGLDFTKWDFSASEISSLAGKHHLVLVYNWDKETFVLEKIKPGKDYLTLSSEEGQTYSHNPLFKTPFNAGLQNGNSDIIISKFDAGSVVETYNLTGEFLKELESTKTGKVFSIDEDELSYSPSTAVTIFADARGGESALDDWDSDWMFFAYGAYINNSTNLSASNPLFYWSEYIRDGQIPRSPSKEWDIASDQSLILSICPTANDKYRMLKRQSSSAVTVSFIPVNEILKFVPICANSSHSFTSCEFNPEEELKKQTWKMTSDLTSNLQNTTTLNNPKISANYYTIKKYIELIKEEKICLDLGTSGTSLDLYWNPDELYNLCSPPGITPAPVTPPAEPPTPEPPSSPANSPTEPLPPSPKLPFDKTKIIERG